MGAVLVLTPAVSYAASGKTCTGGSVAGGAYSSLTITGFCKVDAGAVNVAGNVTVAPGGELVAAYGGNDIHIVGKVTVATNGVLILGCEPQAFICFNDPDQKVGTLRTHDSISETLWTQDALAVIVHATHIEDDSRVYGGGGGVTCGSSIPNLPAVGPAYIDFEDNIIQGFSIIKGVRSCWAGYIRNTVGVDVKYENNVFADPDASELTTNTVGRNMICFDNSPPVQFGDSHGTPNIVHGKAEGECRNVVAKAT